MQPKSKSPAALARCEAEEFEIEGIANDKKLTTRRQQLSELTGALDFLAFWREDITRRATPKDDSYAWLRAADAFERWRLAA